MWMELPFLLREKILLRYTDSERGISYVPSLAAKGICRKIESVFPLEPTNQPTTNSAFILDLISFSAIFLLIFVHCHSKKTNILLSLYTGYKTSINTTYNLSNFLMKFKEDAKVI